MCGGVRKEEDSFDGYETNNLTDRNASTDP